MVWSETGHTETLAWLLAPYTVKTRRCAYRLVRVSKRCAQRKVRDGAAAYEALREVFDGLPR